MKRLLGRALILYLACGLLLRLVTGGAVLSLGTAVTMAFWPLIVAGWIAKLLILLFIAAVVYLAVIRPRSAP